MYRQKQVRRSLLKPRGGPAKPLEAHVDRELTIADIEHPPKVERQPLKVLRARHRTLARLLARGVPVCEAAVAVGYTPVHAAVLEKDESLRNLVALYQRELKQDFHATDVRLAHLTQDAIDEMQRRLEESPDGLTNREVMEVIALGADRTGYGPASKSSATINVNHGIADQMTAALARVRAEQAVDVTPSAESSLETK